LLATSLFGAVLTTGAIAADRVSHHAIPSPDVVRIPTWKGFYARPTNIYEPIASAATRIAALRIAYQRSLSSTGEQTLSSGTNARRACSAPWASASNRSGLSKM
jgi:hypothetical protein